jgi:hypothetical protein
MESSRRGSGSLGCAAEEFIGVTIGTLHQVLLPIRLQEVTIG